MVPNTTRGHSHKGLADYLATDKETGAERDGFVTFLNFHDGEAETIQQAAKVMALTVRDADWLKERAGIRPGGSKAEGPPVWHVSLSWGKGEQVDQAEMERAAESALAAVGLGAVRGYQTYMKGHTDTEHPHIHVAVNLVHPVTGRQANPWRDKQRLQEWARNYERGRGAILCHDREAKYAAVDQKRAKSATEAAFRDAAKGGRPQAQPRRGDPDHQAKADQFGRDRTKARENTRSGRLPYHQWKAQQEAKQQARQADFDSTKALIDGRYAAIRAAEKAGQAKRNAEYARTRDDRQAMRQAIWQSYAEGIDAVWKGDIGKPPDDPARIVWRDAWASVNRTLDRRQDVFQQREQSLFGRWLNAADHAPRGAGLWAIARLAVDADGRRQAFEREQRRAKAKMAPPRDLAPKGRTPRANTPSPKSWQANRLKEMRTAALARHDAESKAIFAALKARHAFERQGEDAARVAFRAASAAEWARFNADHPSQARDGQARDAKASANQNSARDGQQPDSPAASSAGQEKKADRYGRSRTGRKPRQPRREKEMRLSPNDGKGVTWTRPADAPELSVRFHAPAEKDAKAENPAKEAALGSEGNPAGETPEAIHGAPDGQGGTVTGGAGDPAEGKPGALDAARSTEDRAADGRLLSPQDQIQAEIDALRAWREARDAAGREQGGRERERGHER